MRLIPAPLFGLLLCLAILIPASACMWDHDTLMMERERFPSVLELITGKFLRHSTEFYRWRIEDRKQKLKKEPDNLNLYDDLAVAYDKVNEHQLAIDTILIADKKQPDRYETLANLGTFYFHNGELEKGLPFIDRALKINPNAHFGREVYQKLLVEYVLSEKKRALEESDRESASAVMVQPYEMMGFGNFVIGKLGIDDRNYETIEAEKGLAAKGVLGMMKFGNHASPILLDALAGTLSGRHTFNQQLAARAYLKASYESTDPEAKAKYRGKASGALHGQSSTPVLVTQMQLSDVEAEFKNELAEADAWYARVKHDELDWIKAGVDVDAAFDAKYYTEPAISNSFGQYLRNYWWLLPLALLALAFNHAIRHDLRKRKQKGLTQ